MTRLAFTRTLLVVASAAAGCGGGGSASTAPASPPAGGASAPAPANPATADSLEKLFREIRAARDGGEFAKAAKLTRGLIPDETSARKALRDEAGDTAKKMAERYASDPFPPDEKAASLLAGKPGQTEVKVHGATTEEIAAYADGSVPFREFPGGARTAAQKVLRAGLTFYEVEWLEPGKEEGMKYHLFFHDGSGWKMLGKVWQALEK